MRRSLTLTLVAVAAAAAADVADAGAAAAASRTCRTAETKVTAGRTVTLRLTCRRGVRTLATARGMRWSVTARPRRGTLGRLDVKTGRVRFTARTAGTDQVGFTIRTAAGTRLRGRLVLRISAAPKPASPAAPAPQPAPPAPATASAPAETPRTPDPEPRGDGLPAPLPLVQGSIAATTRNWTPAAQDTCPKSLHERFSVIGPDGRRYPGWHPPTVVDPATGAPCTFGHEHGTDPRTSDLYDWVSEHLAADGYGAFAGVPFGLAAEALDTWATANPPMPKRSEDHVGYKVNVADDVRLLGADGAALGTTCDYLTVVHQGSHSADALSNNVHELLYAVRCDDGTQVIADIISRFGDAGQYTRACDPSVKVATTDNGYPDGPGERSIPDRACVDADVLVPPGQTTSMWSLYEKWSSQNALTLGGGATLARFDTAFGVFDPSRYPEGTTLRRTIDLCTEVTPSGDAARGALCDGVPAGLAFDDARSPLDGTHRDVYLAGTEVDNDGGPRRWWTDPYGGNASATPFPGGVCQLVAPTDNTSAPKARVRVFDRNRDNDAEGVHAPN